MIYEKPDHYSKQAQAEGYFARSIYKLKEIEEKFHLFKKGQKICDLGCAPGSWSQYALELIGEKGLLVGIDYKEIKVSAPNAYFIHGNFLREEKQDQIREHGPFDGIISDMAPDTTGDKFSDNIASSELVKEALSFAYDFLSKGGFFIAKVFQGGEEKEIMNEMGRAFVKTKWFKPKSSRSVSNEIFMIGWDFIIKPEKKKPEKNDNPFPEDSQDMPW